jgi:hypothetical protein
MVGEGATTVEKGVSEHEEVDLDCNMCCGDWVCWLSVV